MAESAAPTSLTGAPLLAAAVPPESPSFTCPLDLSVVVPLYNEEGSLPHLIEQVLAALRPLPLRFEVVLVDDGSRDGTPALLRNLAGRVPELVAVLLRRNYGQTAAMAAGFDASKDKAAQVSTLKTFFFFFTDKVTRGHKLYCLSLVSLSRGCIFSHVRPFYE